MSGASALGLAWSTLHAPRTPSAMPKPPRAGRERRVEEHAGPNPPTQEIYRSLKLYSIKATSGGGRVMPRKQRAHGTDKDGFFS